MPRALPEPSHPRSPCLSLNMLSAAFPAFLARLTLAIGGNLLFSWRVDFQLWR